MKRITLAEKLREKKILVLDGSMSTALERFGCDLRDPLWTARILINEPEKIRQVHLDYLRAGADAGITASYQASVRGRFHKDRAAILWEEAGCDLLLFETEPSLDEARVEADVAEELEAAYGVSFSCGDGSHTCGGARIGDCSVL